ncbi:MAG TPA: TerC family protein [Chloroflexota bacterium]|jgi:tellurite resistance protein TerC|nr:TerC family protein [Chloroflexota bacterium]
MSAEPSIPASALPFLEALPSWLTGAPSLAGVSVWVWAGFLAFVVGMLAVDLLVFHKEAHAVSAREAAAWSVVWIALGLAFGGVIWWWRGATQAGEYLAGYLLEKSLSVDNVFVFALVFTYFAVPAKYQHRVLFWGVLGAIVFRALFIAAGAALLDTLHWIIYVFGAFLVFTGIKMIVFRTEELHPESNPALRLLRRVVPMTAEYHGQKFFVRQRRDGALRWLATPLFAVLVVVETTDVIFAVDSIPAIFAVTRDPFLVFTSNAFAILGLRALYFLLADLLHRFVYLKAGLGVVLAFAGVKMLISEVYKMPVWLSLSVIALVITGSMVASLVATRRGEGARRRSGEPAEPAEPAGHLTVVLGRSGTADAEAPAA